MTAKQAKSRIQKMGLDQTNQAIVLNIVESVEETAFLNLISKVLEFHRKEFPFDNDENRDRYYFISGFLNSIKENEAIAIVESKINEPLN